MTAIRWNKKCMDNTRVRNALGLLQKLTTSAKKAQDLGKTKALERIMTGIQRIGDFIDQENAEAQALEEGVDKFIPNTKYIKVDGEIIF